MDADGHLLVIGGPGSGKTTISILKAAQISVKNLGPSQEILFLSFARATVSRVVEAIEYEHDIPAAQKRVIRVETYHSFFWRLLKTHGYLVGLPRNLTILTPPGEAIALASVRSAFPIRKISDEQKAAKKAAETIERDRLARTEGRVPFDLYAPLVAEILSGSQRLRRLVATMYPVVILDEFQDTNESQWQVVKALGEFCRLIALADPEQRIFDWLGANPARLDQFREAFHPTEVDLSTDNHRSAGTDIAHFGNAILTGHFDRPQYAGVTIERFEPYSALAMSKLVTTIYAARQRLVGQGKANWSIAVLVPTKKMTRLVSDSLRAPPAGMHAVAHWASIDMDGAVLAAEVIAHMMQPSDLPAHEGRFVSLLCDFFQGKDGDEPTQGALKEAAGIRKAYSEFLISRVAGKAARKNSIIVNIMGVYQQASSLHLTGDPDKDWRALRGVFEQGACPRLQNIADEARNIRVLDRGTELRQQLAQDWRTHGAYRNALEIVRHAFIQEHFSTNAKPETGVVVMNMHKAKGKQFDEVIIFEHWPIPIKGQPPYNGDRIVRFNSVVYIDEQTKQNFRVSITRGKQRVTILTPKNDPCVFLP